MSLDSLRGVAIQNSVQVNPLKPFCLLPFTFCLPTQVNMAYATLRYQ
ncbi:hypothetical protein Aazo_4582 ['Nostoc azollae' 0708]|uniref:Uncharacterized protein n=1 Tax=Nostoc azollae (strain 0708) TaxID=551115 RepID=D7DXB7_NOSA0|nr:hypothetical protein Aazo_4582 ['Nostoc azollae' 0708]